MTSDGFLDLFRTELVAAARDASTLEVTSDGVAVDIEPVAEFVDSGTVLVRGDEHINLLRS